MGNSKLEDELKKQYSIPDLKGKLAAPRNFGSSMKCAATKIIAEHEAEEASKARADQEAHKKANRIQGAEALKNAKDHTAIAEKSLWISFGALAISIIAVLAAFFK